MSLPTDFPPTEIAPYVADTFGPGKIVWPYHGTVHSAGWRGEVFEQRTQRTTSDGRQTELVLRVTARPDGGSYVRLDESGIPDRVKRDETLASYRAISIGSTDSSLRRHGCGNGPVRRLLSSTASASNCRAKCCVASQSASSAHRPPQAGSSSPTTSRRCSSCAPSGSRRRYRRDTETDVYEFYWADLIPDTTLSQVYGWSLRLYWLPPQCRIGTAEVLLGCACAHCDPGRCDRLVSIDRTGHPAPRGSSPRDDGAERSRHIPTVGVRGGLRLTSSGSCSAFSAMRHATSNRGLAMSTAVRPFGRRGSSYWMGCTTWVTTPESLFSATAWEASSPTTS